MTPKTKNSLYGTYLRTQANFLEIIESGSCFPNWVCVARNSACGASARSMEEDADFKLETKMNLWERLKSMEESRQDGVGTDDSRPFKGFGTSPRSALIRRGYSAR